MKFGKSIEHLTGCIDLCGLRPLQFHWRPIPPAISVSRGFSSSATIGPAMQIQRVRVTKTSQNSLQRGGPKIFATKTKFNASWKKRNCRCFQNIDFVSSCMDIDFGDLRVSQGPPIPPFWTCCSPSARRLFWPLLRFNGTICNLQPSTTRRPQNATFHKQHSNKQ